MLFGRVSRKILLTHPKKKIPAKSVVRHNWTFKWDWLLWSDETEKERFGSKPTRLDQLTSASLLPETAEEVWNEPQNPQVLLHLHCGEHPDRLYHRLVWKQHRWQPQGSAKGRANCPPHCWRWASLPPGHLHQAVYKESPEDYQRLQPPVPQSALSAALRETSPQHPIPH